MKSIYYVAHPVTGDPVGNCEKVMAWLRWLTEVDPTRIYIAPWVAEVLAHKDAVIDPQFYDRVLSDDEEVIQRLDGVVLVGIGTSGPYHRDNGMMRSTGMTRELAATAVRGGDVFDLRRFATVEDARRIAAIDGLTGTQFMDAYKVRGRNE